MSMNEGFIRQRRNLMISSIGLFLVSIGGITLDKKMSLMGAELHIANSLILYISLWGMYIYFFVRYFQYYLEIDDNLKDYWIKDHVDGSNIITNERFSLFGGIANLIGYLFHKVLKVLSFLFHVIFKKNFSDYFFPIVFAAFVGWSSYNSSFTNQNKDAAKLFIEKNILDITVYKMIKDIKEQIHLSL